MTAQIAQFEKHYEHKTHILLLNRDIVVNQSIIYFQKQTTGIKIRVKTEDRKAITIILTTALK